MEMKNICNILIIFFSSLLLLCGCQNIVPMQGADKVEGKTADSNLADNEMGWKWIVEPGKYEDLFFVDDELIAVKDNKGKYIVININGESVIPFEYESISKFNEDVAFVNIDGYFSYIDKNGLSISKDTFQDGYSFSESYSAVKHNNMWGFIDLSGNVSIKYQYEEVNSFSESRAAVKVDNKWGFIDNAGEMIIKPLFDQVRNFKEGAAAVNIDDKWGFIDISGNFIADIQYDNVKDFCEDYAAVMKNGKWGFVDKSGKLCIDFKYDDAGNFSEGKASVKLYNYKEGMDAWAYIDKNDNVVIDFYPYDASEGRIIWIGDFKDGLAFVSKTLYCIIDDKGNDVFLGDSEFFICSLNYNTEYDAIPGYVYTDDKMIEKKYGLLDLNGNQRLEPIFDYVYGFNGRFLIVEQIVGGEYKKGVIELIK